MTADDQHASWLPWVVFFLRLYASRSPDDIMVITTMETKVRHYRLGYMYIGHELDGGCDQKTFDLNMAVEKSDNVKRNNNNEK